jgi:putative tricarboxylic transport membrane protein
MLEAAIQAAQHLFSPGPILAMLVVLPVALFSGITPGGNLPIAVFILGFAGYFDAWITVTAVIFYLAANDITEPVPSILLGIPGSRSAQATVLDGYPMAQKGLAGIALGASYMGDLVGGIIGALVLLLTLPLSRELLKLFGSAEFFLLSLLGLVAVAVVSAGAFVKGMLTASLGLVIAMIGSSPIDGVVRANFGIDYLWDGVPLAPVVVGLFAIPEAIDLVVGDRPIARERLDIMIKEASQDIYKGMREALKHKWLLVRSALVGTFVGMMPGVGGSTAHWIAYVQARHTEKGGTETFGKGDVRGIIASDSAVNAVDGAELIPTVVFGIPGSGGMAILLAILVLSGVQPGPSMLTTHLDLTLSLVYTVVIANVVGIPIMIYAGRYILRLAVIPANILAPIVIGLVTLAAYQASYAMEDLLLVLAFGTLGVFMKRYGWPRPPILIAVVLSQTVEKYFWISMNTYGIEMLYRPQFLSITALMIAVIFVSMRLQRKGLKAEVEAAQL